MFVVDTSYVGNPKYISSFPTKRHWRGKSRVEDIEAGLSALVEEIRKRSSNCLPLWVDQGDGGVVGSTKD